MQYNPEVIARHLWIVLIFVIIVTAVVVVFEPGKEPRSSCTGFQYFVFLSQKMTENGYDIELLNGVRDAAINNVSIDGRELMIEKISEVSAGNAFVISSVGDPVSLKAGDSFRYRVVVFYDMPGIKDNRDVGICTGKVQ